MKGFDEKFFLYFEEYDLCKRVKKRDIKFLSYRLQNLSIFGVKVVQKMTKNIQAVFNQSRFFIISKHYGWLAAIGINVFLHFGKIKSPCCQGFYYFQQ